MFHDGLQRSGRFQPLTGSGVFAVARFNPDGSLDVGFDGDGKVTTVVASRLDRFAVVGYE